MVRARRAAGPIVLAVGLLLAVFAVPAFGQQPYPPPPPPGGPPVRAEASCEVEPPRTVACEGEGYLAGSSVTIEIHAVGRGGGGRRVASDTVVVGVDGTWDYERALGCEARSDRVRVRVSGRDANDRTSTHTFQLDVGPPPPGCTQVAAGGEAQDADDDDDDSSDGARGEAPGGEDEGTNVAADERNRGGGPTIGGHVLSAVDTNADGSLAVTGRNITLVAALALVLVTLGTVLVAARRRRGA